VSLYINLFEYENRPFAEGLRAYVYSPIRKLTGRDDETLLGAASRNLEGQIGKNSVVVQYEDDIYCVPFDPAVLPKEILAESRMEALTWTLSPDHRRLAPADENDREIIRRLAAKAIAKKQIERGWFVQPFGFAYHWSFNLSKQLYTERMDVYPGFVFRPYVYEDGSSAIMVDPRFKFVSKKTLRDVIDDLLLKNVHEERIRMLFRGDFVIDACPVAECPHKRDPSSTCRLKGSGSRRRLMDFDFHRKPSEATIGSLMDYHRSPTVCQFYGRIAEKIIDRPPIALVEKWDKTKFLEYPVERLREELKLEGLGRSQRLLIMKYIQPPMNARWKLTDNFITYVDQIPIGRLVELKLIRAFAKAGTRGKLWERHFVFEEIPLAFASKASSYDPLLGLERNGPYDLNGDHRRRFSSLRIAVCNCSSKLGIEDLNKFYNDFVEGFSRGARFAGMRGLFHLQIQPFSEDCVYSNLGEIRELAQTASPDIVIVITPQLRGHKVRQYESFKYELTRDGIASQFVLEDKFDLKSMPSRYASYMKNLALSIYYKVGGIPWVLSRPTSHNSCYIGLGAVTRGDVTYMSLQVFNSSGKWLGGWSEFVDKDAYSQRLVDRVREAQSIYAKETGNMASRIVLHKDGEIWPYTEMQPLIDAFQSRLECVSVKRATLPRLYDPVTRTDYVVKRGSCVQISDSSALLAASGPPHPMPGSQRPLTIELKSRDGNSSQLMNACREIFGLSLVHGYSLAVIAKPITTHFAQKAMSLMSKYNIVESPLLWRKAWFL
jgi:hypothetical protein